MTEIISINGTQINVVSENDTFVVSNKEVALAFGAGETSIRNMKNRNKDELLENVHWVTQIVSGSETTFWTKKGIITLGFKLQTTPKTIAFRDWASDYLIAPQKVLSTSEQIMLIAQGHQETEQRLNTLEYKIDNDIPLTSAQKHNVKQKVNALVYKLKKDHNLHDDFIPKCYSRVWKKVKNHFIVSSYMEIPKSKFDELVMIIDSITISDVV